METGVAAHVDLSDRPVETSTVPTAVALASTVQLNPLWQIDRPIASGQRTNQSPKMPATTARSPVAAEV